MTLCRRVDISRRFEWVQSQVVQVERFNAVHTDVLFDSQGIRIIQPNTSFLLFAIWATRFRGYAYPNKRRKYKEIKHDTEDTSMGNLDHTIKT